MSEKLDIYSKSFQALQVHLTKLAAGLGKYQQQVGHFSNLIKGGCSTLGDRLQVLIDGGLTCKTLDDFIKHDAQLQQMKAKLDQLQTSLERDLAEGVKLHADIKIFLKAGGDLIKLLKEDVARRKLKEKSKSLEMEQQLLKKVEAFADGRDVTELATFVPETADNHRKQLARYLEQEFRQAKPARVSARAAEFIRRAFDQRLLLGALAQSKTTREDAELALNKAKFMVAKAKATKDEALRAKCMKEFGEAKESAGALKTRGVEVARLAALYSDGLEDDYIKGQLKYREEGEKKKILEAIAAIIDNDRRIAAAIVALIRFQP
jgi:hypothetical protein